MKHLLKIFLIIFLISCGTKQDKKLLSKVDDTSKMQEETLIAKHEGIVTYKFSSSGCNCLIVFSDKNEKEIVLIPFPDLEITKFPEGSKIKFNYILSRRPQPKNCTKGIPAILSDIEIIK